MKTQVLDYKPIYLDALQGKEKVAGSLAFEEKVHPQWFDFTLESLYYIDSYLLSVYVAREELNERQVENTMWAIGFYLGEVIKQNADKNYEWKNWDEFFSLQDANIQEAYYQTMGTAAVLVAEDGTFILPIDRVIEFMSKGPENSLHYYASQEAEPASV